MFGIAEDNWNFIEKFIIFFFIILITFFVERLVRRYVRRYAGVVSTASKVNLTRYSFLKHFISAFIYLIGISVAIYNVPELRALSVSVFAGAGILAVIIGFASQQAFSNVVSGIFLLIFKPFRVGDRIKVQKDITGIVEDVTLRHTIIRNFENKRIIIPNSVISNEIIENSDLGDEKICKFMDFTISYESDIDRALRIMQEEALMHPNLLDNRTEEQKLKGDPVVTARVIGLTDNGVSLRAWVWSRDPPSAFVMGCDLLKSTKERFDREGIVIPYPHITIANKLESKRIPVSRGTTPKKKAKAKRGRR